MSSTAELSLRQQRIDALFPDGPPTAEKEQLQLSDLSDIRTRLKRGSLGDCLNAALDLREEISSLYQAIMRVTGRVKAPPEVGERVGVMLSEDAQNMSFLGYGVRVEDETPEESAGGLAGLVRSMSEKSPCLLLDSGQKVYGCECWWGHEEEVRERAGNRVVTNVNIDDVRAGRVE